jgi:DNA-binding MarR family transcriptional regulator
VADLDRSAQAPGEVRWTFFTNHAHVLFCLMEAPDLRIRDMALRIGITERAVQRILQELTAGGYVVVEREGRRNRYSIQAGRPLRHPVEQPHIVRDLLEFFVKR